MCYSIIYYNIRPDIHYMNARLHFRFSLRPHCAHQMIRWVPCLCKPTSGVASRELPQVSAHLTAGTETEEPSAPAIAFSFRSPMSGSRWLGPAGLSWPSRARTLLPPRSCQPLGASQTRLWSNSCTTQDNGSGKSHAVSAVSARIPGKPEASINEEVAN